MRLSILVSLSIFLTACQSGPKHFSLPEKVNFQGKSYEKVTDNKIETMQSLLYLPSDGSKNAEKWGKGILLFLDTDKNKTMESRVALRQTHFRETEAFAQVGIENNELRSKVIYPPSGRFNDVQLEVSRGKQSECGYGQIQYSEKRQVAQPNNVHLSSYTAELVELANQFNYLAWQIKCQ